MIACKDCRFHDDSYGNNCTYPAMGKPDPVHGSVLETCHNARSETGKCGPNAMMFDRRRGFFERLGLCAVTSQNYSPTEITGE